MNIFWLDYDIEKAARAMNDVYTYNHIRENGNMILAALMNNGVPDEVLPDVGVSHQNHPCTEWVGHSLQTMFKTLQFTRAIHNEYRYRYGEEKTHGWYEYVMNIPTDIYKEYLPDTGELPEPPQTILDAYKCNDFVTAYRYYYVNEKYPKEWCVYEKGRNEPHWIDDYKLDAGITVPYLERKNIND